MKEKQTNNTKTCSYFMSSMALMVCKKGKNRSWSFCKTSRPMTWSSKKWTLISNRTAKEMDSKPSVARVTISNVWKKFHQTSIQKIFRKRRGGVRGYEYRNTARGRERKPQYRIKIYPNTETAVANGKKLPFSRLKSAFWIVFPD